MIHISLSPNTQNDDRRLAASLLLQPSAWQNGEKLKALQKGIATYLNIQREPILFNSGRSAFFTLLKALHLKTEDEILIQAFTCNAVPGPILWHGLRPVYVDIDSSYNMDADDLEKKITPRSKAIVIQHTFGMPANMDTLVRIARNHKLFIIEDCAHALGAEWRTANDVQKLGTLGDAAFFSFGRDKIISSVYGGALIVFNEEVERQARREWQELAFPSKRWILQQLLHPVLLPPIIATYWIFGRFLLKIAQNIRVLSLAVTPEEKLGKKPSYFPARFPNALAALALHQLKKIDALNSHRRELASFYAECMEKQSGEQKTIFDELRRPLTRPGSIFLRYPLRHPKRDEILRMAKKRGMLLGDWYDSVIAPKGTDFSAMRYDMGSCPRAERASRETFNLPTHINITKNDARAIIGFLQTVKIKNHREQKFS